MRFRFVAVDGGGRIVRGVLRGDSEEDARESLLADGHFPKALEETAEDEPVTWASKGRFRARQEAAATSQAPSRLIAEARLPSLLGDRRGGTLHLRLSSDGTLTIDDAKGHTVAKLHAEKLELAAILGFPARVLRLVTLEGVLYDFHAGWFFAVRAAKQLAKRLQEARR